MLWTPFPRPSLRTYVVVGLIIGACISFILIVFEPFGTDQFVHPYKTLILMGYGITSASTVALYYVLSLYAINKNRESRWNIMYETIDLFICLIISMLATYVYYSLVFEIGFNLSRMLGFLEVAMAVSFLPTLAVFIYLFYEYRGVIRSTMTISSSTATLGKVTLRGTGKNESIETSLDALRFIKADDNYVIIHLFDGDKEQRHMIRSTLKLISQQLDNTIFYQCHRSYIINTKVIHDLIGNKNSAKLILSESSKSVPVSRSHYDFIKTIAPKKVCN